MTSTPRIRKDTAQVNRFIKAAREAECSEDEADFDANLKRIVTAKVEKTDTPKAS